MLVDIIESLLPESPKISMKAMYRKGSKDSIRQTSLANLHDTDESTILAVIIKSRSSNIIIINIGVRDADISDTSIDNKWVTFIFRSSSEISILGGNVGLAELHKILVSFRGYELHDRGFERFAIVFINIMNIIYSRLSFDVGIIYVSAFTNVFISIRNNEITYSLVPIGNAELRNERIRKFIYGQYLYQHYQAGYVKYKLVG